MTKQQKQILPVLPPSNYIQKITHMWITWGITQNFFLAFPDKLEKQICIHKQLQWAKINFHIYKVVFLEKKIKKNTWRYHYFTPVYQKSWQYDLQFLTYIQCDRLKLVIMVPLSLKTKKIRILKIWKTIAGNILILHKCIKNHNQIKYCSWDTEWGIQNFLSFWAIFWPFTP